MSEANFRRKYSYHSLCKRTEITKNRKNAQSDKVNGLSV